MVLIVCYGECKFRAGGYFRFWLPTFGFGVRGGVPVCFVLRIRMDEYRGLGKSRKAVVSASVLFLRREGGAVMTAGLALDFLVIFD